MAGLKQPHPQAPFSELATLLTNLIGQDIGLGFSPIAGSAAGMIRFPTANKGPFSAAIRGSVLASPEGPISKYVEALRSLGRKKSSPARMMQSPTKELPFRYERGVSMGPSDTNVPKGALRGKFNQESMDRVMEVIDTVSRHRIPGEARQLADMWNKLYNPFGAVGR